MSATNCQVGLTLFCPRKFTVVLAACLAISGCASGPRGGTDPGHPGLLDRSPVVIQSGSLKSPFGPDLVYRRYVAPRARAGELAVVAHGFMRGQDQMASLAAAIAGAGVTAITLDFRPQPIWAGNPMRYALEMMHLARAQDARRVVYVGFSAGALAALLAGRNDPRAVGVIALDLVDREGLGARAAAGLKPPMVGLVGAPSRCNRHNNGRGVFAAADAATVRPFSGASHCDFESDPDWLCRLVCPPGSDPPHQASRRILRTTVTEVLRLMSR
jgi:dienelactone hydrolase